MVLEFYGEILSNSQLGGLCTPANSSCTHVIHGSKAKYTSGLERPIMVVKLKLYGVKYIV